MVVERDEEGLRDIIGRRIYILTSWTTSRDVIVYFICLYYIIICYRIAAISSLALTTLRQTL